MKNKTKLILVAIILILLVLTGISKAPADNLASQQIAIGAVLPLTGGLAFAGEDLHKGMMLAAEETGIKLEFQDGEGNPQKSLNAARIFADVQKYPIILTAFRGATLSIASGLHDKGTVIFSITGTADGQSVSASSTNLFAVGPEVVQSAKVLGDHARAYDSCSAYAAISEQTDPGLNKVAGFKKGIQVEPAIVEIFDPATNDFRTLISKLKEENVDCLFAELKSNAMPIFLKQADENKFYPKIYSTSYSVTPAVLAASPKSELDNLTVSITVLDPNKPATKKFADAYRLRYSKEPTDWSALGYETVKIAAEPARTCKHDTACIKRALMAVQGLESTLGILNMEANQEIHLRDYGLFEVKDGAFVNASK